MNRIPILLSAFLTMPILGVVAQEQPLHVAVCVGQGKKGLETYVKHLQAEKKVKISWVESTQAKQDKGTKKHVPTPFTNLEALEKCDVILSNLYRTWAPDSQLPVLQKAFQSKPVVGLRKAHHGFQNWLEADREVFGVRYRGHYFGKNVTQTILPEGKDHPFLDSLIKESKLPFPGGGLYQHQEVADDVRVLIVGNPEGKPPMPQTWLREVKERGGQRVVYTRYDPNDLAKEASVRDLVTRALWWAAGK